MCETSEIRAGSATPRWPQVWLAPTSLGRDLPGLQALQQQVVEREKLILNVEEGLEKVIRKVDGPGVPGQAG